MALLSHPENKSGDAVCPYLDAALLDRCFKKSSTDIEQRSSFWNGGGGEAKMMGRRIDQRQLFYEFNLDDVIRKTTCYDG